MSFTSTGLVSFNGIESGLDTASIISAYMAADQGPLNLLQAEQTSNNNKIAAYQTIESQLEALQTAAAAATSASSFAGALKATSTNSAVASATTGTGATAGSVTFSVNQLATADTRVSAGTVAATTDVVASGNLLIGAGAAGVGISGFSGDGLAAGAHTIAVTQASAGASVVGSQPAASTTIDGTNDQLSVVLDGQAQTFTLAAGTYTASQLAAAVTAASGGALVGSLSSAGQLQITTAEQGSAATLQVAGGSATALLGLAPGGPVAGTDGVITVDGQANTVTDIAADGSTSVTLDAGGGATLTATLAGGGLSTGSVTAQSISTGNGSLASVVSAVNAAHAGVTAQALAVGKNQYALEITSNTTGAGNDVAIDQAAFAGSGLGALTTTTAGQDAVVSLGGPGGYQVTSASNSLTGLLPGVTISLSQVSSTPVTVSVNPDGQAAAATVQSLVSAANQVLSTIATATAYNATTNTAGVLNGDYALQGIAQQILGQFGLAIGTSPVVDSGSAGSAAGLSINGSTGQISFDATAFATAYDNDPSAVAAMFTQGGTFTPAGGSPAGAGDVSFVYAGAGTQPASYPVAVTQSASQAADTATAGFASAAATVGAAESYTVTTGGTSATYGVGAGESLADVVAGLNTAFASAGMLLSAQVVTNNGSSSVQITSADYGADQTFSVSASGADQLGLVGSFSGTDVAGTIDGIAATGAGQVLSAPVDDPVLAGLSLLVTTPGITSATPLGSFTYAPGLAGGLSALAGTSTGLNGEITATVAGLQNTNTSLASQITLEQQLLSQQQDALTKEFNNLESTLSSLKSESSYLSSLGSAASGSVSGG